jgi:hypothetical protein
MAGQETSKQKSKSGAAPTEGADTNEETDAEAERCKQAKEECIEECLDALGGPRWNQGMPYFRCINKCMRDKGCPGVLAPGEKYEDE